LSISRRLALRLSDGSIGSIADTHQQQDNFAALSITKSMVDLKKSV